MRLESLGERITPSVSATWTLGTLTITGDNKDNSIEVSRDPAGQLLVNNGAIAIRGGTPTVTNTIQIKLFGQKGDDSLSLNETNGALPSASLYGGAGNDLLIGGSANDSLFGEAGNDILLGKGGADLLFGGANDDMLTGGDGADQVFGEAGNDWLIWNPGDDTDLNEGGTDVDTVQVNGGNGAENFTVTANGTRVRFDRIDPAPFTLDIGTSEKLVLNANGGDDHFSATGNLASLIQITVDGGSGNDVLSGSNGDDVLRGGDGMDFIDGQQGNDVAELGPGDDVFQWDPGDGNDRVEGQAGADTLVFNGSATSEIFDVSANAGRVRLTRNVGNVVMDLDDIERIDLQALGGADTIAVNELSGTDLVQVNANLAGVLGGNTGDTQQDTVSVAGTDANDTIDVYGSGTSVAVIGLSAVVNITNTEGANDALLISSLGGDDGVTAATLPAGVIKLSIDGGADDDVIIGSVGPDVLLGGSGNDFLLGQQGNDVILMGEGDDLFQWDPGHGSDVVEGESGFDSMLFFGSNASENIDIAANGGRVLFFRNIASVSMDLNGVESLEYRALGGADNIAVGDLTGTNVSRIDLELQGPNGGGDGQADTVTVAGTQGDDSFGVAGDAGGIIVLGLPTEVRIFHQEQANDRLILNALGGADVVNATALQADGISLTINGGLGNDTLFGSEGADLISGGDGNDSIHMGPGDDTFVWNPGDDSDTIVGDSGFDTVVFNGANVAENLDISAQSGHVRVWRDVAAVTLDLDDVEGLDVHAQGGADTIVIHDLAGTDLIEANVDLSIAGGSGDGQPDSVVLFGSTGDDVAVVVGDASGVAVLGLATQVNITGAEPALDRLTIITLDGDDVVDASGLAATGIGLTADGGGGNDVLIGSDGADILFGGDGDDVLIGGPGVDVLNGGPGDNIVIQ